MASNTFWFDELFEALFSAHKILKCPICLEKMINPSQLTPCGHIFCQLCIKKVNVNPQNHPCPLCSKLYSRRNIVSVKEQMAEYKDMLDRLVAQVSLDVGFDITSHIVDRSSTNESFSPIRKKCTFKNIIDNVNREDSKINQQDAIKNNISNAKGENFKINKQNTNKSNLKISNIKGDNLKINDQLELNLKPVRRSSRRKSSIEDVKNTPNLDKYFSKVSTSTDRMITINSENSGDESIVKNQFSEEDLDIFVRKSIRTESRSRAKTKPIQNKIKSVSKKKNSKLKMHQNNDISHEEELQGTVDKMKIDPSSNEIISATKFQMKKSASFSKSDLEDISDNRNNLKISLKKDINCSPTYLQARNSDMELKFKAFEPNMRSCNGHSNSSPIEQKKSLNMINIITPVNESTEICLDNLEANTNVDSTNTLVNRLEDKVNNFKQKFIKGSKQDEGTEKKNIVRSEMDKSSCQNEKEDEAKKYVMGRKVHESNQLQKDKSESLINKMEEQNPKKGDKQKRKRLERCLAQNTNVETNLESPLVKSPVRKRHCSDIGIQTSPSRLLSLFNDPQTMILIKETEQKQFINQPSITPFESPIEKCRNNDSYVNIISSEHKTPFVSNIIQHHSTPMLGKKKENSIDDDISIQITQRNPKFKSFNSDTKCGENHLEENRHDLIIGNMKTPMMNKILLPGNCSNQKFSVISNPTTSERRRINDSKFFNDSFGIPGDSLLENSDLSSSILQNTVSSVILTELIESTPPTIHEKSKRISRKLLDIFEDESDMFDTNNEEEVLDKPSNPSLLIVESETHIECPVTLDTNKHEIVQTDSQKSDVESESSSKENKNPEVIQDLFSDEIKSLESSSRNENTFLKEKNDLKNIMSQKDVPSGSGILIANNTPQSSMATFMNSQSDLIKKTAEVIEDSDEDEEQCLIEATPEKLSQPMTQSITLGIYNTYAPKDFCFVTSSLLPSQLRYVKILAEVLGCRITPNITQDTSHLIIQTCEKGRAKRTLKYLQAIATHKVVVSYNWVTSSLEEKVLLDVEPYIVYDTWGAEAVHRSLKKSGNYLLQRFAIAVAEPTIELTVLQIDELLDACGAIVIKDPRCFNFVPHKLLRVILTDKEDVCEVAIGWLKKYKAVTLRVDWLVNTIGQYEVTPLNGYLQIPMKSEILLGLGFPQELIKEDDEDVDD